VMSREQMNWVENRFCVHDAVVVLDIFLSALYEYHLLIRRFFDLSCHLLQVSSDSIRTSIKINRKRAVGKKIGHE
jgi:hypothetical protein